MATIDETNYPKDYQIGSLLRYRMAFKQGMTDKSRSILQRLIAKRFGLSPEHSKLIDGLSEEECDERAVRIYEFETLAELGLDELP